MKDIGNVVILGDSYSTFAGYIPEGYAAYYKETAEGEMDVLSVEQTWWHQLLQSTKSNLLLNSSYSGTTLCHTGYNGSDCKNISFAARLDKLIEEGFFINNRVDTFFLFGGTNDSWANSPLGEHMSENIEFKDLYNVLPAMEYIASKLRTTLPDAKIVCVINIQLKQIIKDTFKMLCEKYGFLCVEITELDMISGHPTAKGMGQIKDKILETI